MRKDSARAVRFDDLPWEERGAARLKEVTAHGRRIRLVEFLPGFSDPNWCLKGHAVYVLQGVVDSHYADGVSTRAAGEAYIIPAGVKHRSANPYGQPARLLVVDEG